MSFPDITKEGQMVSALQDIASALEHIARSIDTHNNYRFTIAKADDNKEPDSPA